MYFEQEEFAEIVRMSKDYEIKGKTLSRRDFDKPMSFASERNTIGAFREIISTRLSRYC